MPPGRFLAEGHIQSRGPILNMAFGHDSLIGTDPWGVALIQ
jgi:hypothetical protein